MESKKIFERSDVSQESQYAFPYHYIPSFENGNFCQHLYWSWGFRYFGGIELILRLIEKEPFESLVDIGCGDGRFLREVNMGFPNKTLMGIDYSLRAITLARAMNPDLNYECRDICLERVNNQAFDVVTLVEVLEHIPADSVDDFVYSIAGFHKPGGRLILTVPHMNKPVQVKHYQHFDSDMLRKIVEPFYRIESIVYFDKRTRIFGRLISVLLGNPFFILNNRFLLNALFKIYQRYFRICNEVSCGRICLVARKK